MSEIIKEFVKQYPNKSTRTNYMYSLNTFFKVIGVDADKYFIESRDYEKDVMTFVRYISNRPPKTIKLMVSNVRCFLEENDVEFNGKFWKKVRSRRKGSRALTEDRIPGREELRSILTHGDAKAKAFFLTLSSSGMRIGEALKINVKDVDLEHDPPKIWISGKYTKSGNSRIVFISNETKDTIRDWLKIRDKYIVSAAGRSASNKKSVDDDRLFPFTSANARVMWYKMLEKAGLNSIDEHTKRYHFHIHVLRKYFRTKMASVIPVDIVEALMGHEGYLTEVYRRYPEKQLAEFYTKGEHIITVFTDRNGVKKLRKEVQIQNKIYDESMKRIMAENQDLRLEVKKLNEKLVEHEQSKEKQLGDELIKALEKHPEVVMQLSEVILKEMEKQK